MATVQACFGLWLAMDLAFSFLPFDCQNSPLCDEVGQAHILGSTVALISMHLYLTFPKKRTKSDAARCCSRDGTHNRE